MNIGITTLHNYNFGSALQCFATQEYLASNGVRSEIIDVAGEPLPFVTPAITIANIGLMCLTHPLDAKDIIKIFLSQRGGNLTLSKDSVMALQMFNNTSLNRKVYTKRCLKKLATKDDFHYFFSGSDQVWNGSRVDDYYKYFLRFAPKEKRVSWAASFGGSSVASYNKTKFKKYINDFEHISVREKSGIDLVKQLTGREAYCLPDPVMLLSAEEWSKKIPSSLYDRPYILAFFIDGPSQKSIDMVRQWSAKQALPVVTFGYKHNEFKDAIHLDGGPFEFLSAIKNAELIITDSFHAVAFSTIFHKEFFVNERQYAHNQKQSTRLTDFLSEIKQIERYEADDDAALSSNFEESDRYFANKRLIANDFLNRVIGDDVKCTNEKNVRESKHECCGCGACVDICSHSAIQLKRDADGFYYPVIDDSKCVNCGLCSKVCSFKPRNSNAFAKEAFIATSVEKELIKHSASGGIFAQIAKKVLGEGGIVYGASLWLESGKIHVEHIGIETECDLYKIQGSKYVQSKTQGIFPEINKQLQSGRKVLFGGTSCQVAALKGYLRKDYDTLLTTDLICHGVPSLKMLQDYVDSLDLKNELVDIKFRKRVKGGLPYIFMLTLRRNDGSNYTKEIPLRESAYYRLFMSCAGYRSSCYGCPFASINKPGDITLGDFYLQESKEVTTYPKEIKNEDLLSTVIVNTKKGKEALDMTTDTIVLYSASVDYMASHHGQLVRASIPTRIGDSLLALYHEAGFNIVQKTIDVRNTITGVPSLLHKVMDKLGNK